MAFTKAIVLSKTDFRILVADILDSAMDALEDPYDEKELENYVGRYFEEILNMDEVEEAVIFLDDGVYECYNGDIFVKLIKKHYGVKELKELLEERKVKEKRSKRLLRKKLMEKYWKK